MATRYDQGTVTVKVNRNHRHEWAQISVWQEGKKGVRKEIYLIQCPVDTPLLESDGEDEVGGEGDNGVPELLGGCRSDGVPEPLGVGCVGFGVEGLGLGLGGEGLEDGGGGGE
ncbi:hypothetical protein CCACVL1_17845 [Corchorus capsularis]|uniref:Uncharacterized protein n=1 Tax=Corchorus capsularis TaxID=210143 RepID=A0A1R3HQ58_COCAP|nr:hypothetical protein CCACVL1_17845 [Corchorus capsularis]